MNYLKIFFFGLLLSASAVACGDADNSHDDDRDHMEAVHGDGKEYNSDYVCPMHCDGSGSDHQGQCPVCGMDYIKQEEHIKDGHDH